MNRERKDSLLMIIIGMAFFMDFFSINFFIPPTIGELVAVGWVIFVFGALFFVLSVINLRIKGVSKIVDTGVYSIVRHPMYLGAMVMFLSHIFLGQNWVVVIGGVVAIVCCYLIILPGDERNMEKFGDDYKPYMQRVPRMNLLLGIFRLFRRKEVGKGV